MRRLVITLMLVTTCSLTLAQAGNRKELGQRQRDDIERTLLKMTDEWTQVDVTRDKSLLERFLADDFVQNEL